MCGIGGVELIILLVVVLLVLGPKRLPELAKALGKGLRSFNKLKEDLSSTVRNDPALNKALDEVETLRQGVAQATSLSQTTQPHRPKGRLDPVTGKIVPLASPAPAGPGGTAPAPLHGGPKGAPKDAPKPAPRDAKDGSDVGRAG